MGDIPVAVTSQPPGGHKHVLGDEKSLETSTLGELAAVDPVAEKKVRRLLAVHLTIQLVRKLDMRILPLVTMAYLLCVSPRTRLLTLEAPFSTAPTPAMRASQA